MRARPPRSSVVCAGTTEEGRLFQSGIVLGKQGILHDNMYVCYLRYWALCNGLATFELEQVRYNDKNRME